ncbi:MAG: bifunctional homocysteine S-methyltransferase/methylenetetrahydrofolate reductase [Lachnospiraceae bacterium]
MMDIREYLRHKTIIADGAMGTYYAQITNSQDDVWCEWANLTNGEIIINIHKDYIGAGARLLRTNTFMASCIGTSADSSQSEQIIRKACFNARTAVEKARQEKLLEADESIFIAGDIGPLRETGEYSKKEIFHEYVRMVDIFTDEKVDAIIFETFPDFYILEDVIRYINDTSKVAVIANFCLNKNGYTTSGISATRILKQGKQIEGLDVCGFNCGIGSGHMREIFEKLVIPENMPVAAMPNAGYPERMQNRMVFMNNTGYFADNVAQIAAGITGIVGGCCGTSPEHIRLLRKKLDTEGFILRTGEVRAAETRQRHAAPNHFMDKLRSGSKVIAVELDPPFDADFERLIECGHALKKSGVDIITMADSPMGRSRVDSILMSIKMREETGMEVMPHMCCRDKNMIAMRSTLLGAYINNIRNLLLVTGDPVPGINRSMVTGVFDYNSIQLMNFVKGMNEEFFAGDEFYYGGALNVGLGRVEKIADRMKQKMEAGCGYFLTQPVFSDEDVDRLAQLREITGARILCGIMPFVSYKNATFMQNEFIGINVPDSIIAGFSPEMSRQEAEEAGAAIAGKIIKKVNDVCDGFYFMLPFNRVSLMEKIKPYIS